MSDFYSASSGTGYLFKALDAIEEEKPEYSNFIYFVRYYAPQKWADQTRTYLKVDLSSLEEAIINEREYFGIKTNEGSLTYQKRTLEVTKKILSLLGKTLFDKDVLNDNEFKTMNYVFNGYGKKDELNQFNSFLNGIKKVGEKYYKEFDLLANETNNINKELEPEISIVFHQTEILFLTASLLGLNKRFMYEINSKDLYSIMVASISSLESYNFVDGVDWITKARFQGKSVGRLRITSGKHPDYINKRYQEGLKALDMIFWGYSKIPQKK